MDLSALAGAFGAGLSGYAEEKKRRLAELLAGKQAQGQDDDRLLALSREGYQPVQQGLPSVTDQALAAAGRATGLGQGGPGWEQALRQASAPTPSARTLTQHISGQPRLFAQDYSQSQQGLTQTHQDNMAATRSRESIQAADIARRADSTEAQRHEKAESTEAQRKEKAAQPTWTALGAPDAEGNVIEHSSRGGFRTSTIQMGAKPGSANKATSSQTMMALGRMRQLRDDLIAAHPSMLEMEDPATTNNLTNVDLITKGMGTAAASQPSLENKGGITELMGNTAASVFQGAAQNYLADSPLGQKYRTYTTNGKVIGVGLTEILPRPNNALLGTEIGLSTGDVGKHNPAQTKLVQNRRVNALKGMEAILSMNPQFVDAMLKRDPDWLNNTLHSTIETGVMPNAVESGMGPAQTPAQPAPQRIPPGQLQAEALAAKAKIDALPIPPSEKQRRKAEVDRRVQQQVRSAP